MRKRLSSLFKETTEHSLGLRVLALATAWWAAMALGIVGAPIWIWAGILLLTSFGHVFSFYTRDRPLKLFRLMVVITVLAIAGVMTLQLPTAFDGNWQPAAQSLALVQGIASFDLRSRPGLYTNIVLGGTIMFLASQLAFGSTFLLVLAGFFGFFFLFLWFASTRDLLSNVLARAAWPLRDRVLTFAGWGGALLGLGIVLFILLPWGTLRSGASATSSDAVLPITGLTEPQQRPGDDGGGGTPQGSSASGSGQLADATQVTGADGTAQQSPVAEGTTPQNGAVEVQVGGDEPATLSVAGEAGAGDAPAPAEGATPAEAAASDVESGGGRRGGSRGHGCCGSG